MSQAYRPSWDPCKIFGEIKENSKLKFGENSESLDTEFGGFLPPRIKTVAKAFRKEISQVKATWKSFLPTLSTVDVRRYRVPHYEVVVLELEEAGYQDASQCMKMLFALDEEMRIKAEPGTIIWTNPRLKDRSDFVDYLKIGLSEANREMLGEQRIAQAAALLEIALYFQKTTWEWWWIAEQFFRSALKVSETLEEDDYQTLTTIRYFYGRFLFNEMKDENGSLYFLDKARDASQGKSWNATKILGTKQNTIFRECCSLLYRVFLSFAKKARDNEADVAVEACKNALKHAMDSDHDEYVTEATCELGRSYLRANQPKLALPNFVKYLNLSRKILNYEGICNAHMELALAYKELGDTEKTMEHLELFRETASRFELPYKLAQAHYHIGEHLLGQSHLAQATSHLEFSFSLYNEMGRTVEAHQARCIAAVSKGQEFVDQFIDQILRCGKHDQTATLKLCDWKNDRVPFWVLRKDADESCGENERDDDLPESQISESQLYTDYRTSTQFEIIEAESLESGLTAISTNLVP